MKSLLALATRSSWATHAEAMQEWSREWKQMPSIQEEAVRKDEAAARNPALSSGVDTNHMWLFKFEYKWIKSKQT